VSPQYARFLTVSLAALAIDLVVLVSLAEVAGLPKLAAAAIAIVAATPASFLGNRLWTFG
jgi:dolichol-phosphate mannosyltransferase